MFMKSVLEYGRSGNVFLREKGVKIIEVFS